MRFSSLALVIVVGTTAIGIVGVSMTLAVESPVILAAELSSIILVVELSLIILAAESPVITSVGILVTLAGIWESIVELIEERGSLNSGDLRENSRLTRLRGYLRKRLRYVYYYNYEYIVLRKIFSNKVFI
jgi:hypothetical protein